MTAFLTGLLILGVALLILRLLVTAQPSTIVRALKFALGLAIGLFGIIIFSRGLFMFGFPLMLYGIALVARSLGWQGMPGLPLPGLKLDRVGGTRTSSGGGQSGVRTRYLDMSLDHASGDMDGLIREGRFQGKRLSELNLEQALMLLGDVRLGDPESERLLEAWLDRTYPDWRDEQGAGAADGATGSSGPMTRAEALRILELEGDPGPEEIREAYKRQMKKHHPDQGGTDEDAIRLNAARDLLLST